MTHSRTLCLTTLLLLPAAALAQAPMKPMKPMAPMKAAAASPFDGTWKVDMTTAKMSGKPFILKVTKKGEYSCNCVPPEKFKADGKPHPVKGNPYIDMGTATIASPSELDLSYTKNGKTVLTETVTAGADGETGTFKGTDSTATNAAPVDFSYDMKRTGKAPKGAHAVSGTWVPATASSSDNGLTTTYTVAGTTLTMTSPTGQSYTATLGGPQAPYKGDPGTSTVKVKLIGTDTLEETDYRDGKVAVVTTTTVAPDGKTAKVVTDMKLNDHHFEATANKV